MAKQPKGAGSGQSMYFSSVKASRNVQEGTPGDDDIYSDSGTQHVTVLTGAGNDSVETHDWNAIVQAGTGNDSVISGNAGDQIFGGEGDDYLEGNSFGTRQVDELHGEIGNDTLKNADGFSHMVGGAGADKFIVNTRDALGTTIADFNPAEGDVIRLEGMEAGVAQALAGGTLEDLCARYNLKLDKVKPTDVQMQVTTGDRGEAVIEIRGK